MSRCPICNNAPTMLVSRVLTLDELSEQVVGKHLKDVALAQHKQVIADIVASAETVIEMNRQHALDAYGDAEKAEMWACVTVLRSAIARAKALEVA